MDSTIGSQHTAEKEVAEEGGIYNTTVRGYFNGNLSNLRRCLNRTIWFISETFYCAVIQVVLLFDAETWVLLVPMAQTRLG